MITQEEMQMANKTSRHGGFSMNAVTPKYIASIAKVSDSILDFGAGKDAVHTKFLQETHHLNVVAHEFGANLNENHDSTALNNDYDIVFASNVINVQTSMTMLNTTLTQIFGASKGIVVFNYPKTPRKLELSTEELMVYVRIHFTDDVKMEDSNIIHCKVGTHWTDKHITYDSKKQLYVGWDEAGQHHCEHEDYDKCRDSLIDYTVNVLNKNS